jgi:poly(A) polymerase
MFSWLKQSLAKTFGLIEGDVASSPRSGPRIIPRDQHIISRNNISENALKVLYRLKQAGHEAYLVGGGVRDLLLGREPKDFDVATSARPEEIRRIFRNCRIIGRRFRLAHVHFGDEIIETATFRAQHEEEAEDEVTNESGRLLSDNVWGTLEDDAWRRDFTVNALYYDIRDFSVVDYTGGMEDLEAGRLRVIGDPHQRFREDPVRMLRAVRFAAKLGFRIDQESEDAIHELGHLLADISPARLFDETLKLFQSGYAVETYELLRHYGLFAYLFPETDKLVDQEEEGFPHVFVAKALENTDRRVDEGKPITPAFLVATLLWESVRQEAAENRARGMNELEAMQVAGDAVVARQIPHVAFPKRFTLQAREIWIFQERLKRRSGKRADILFENPRFRASYDLLMLRAQCGEDVGDLADWWTRFQGQDPTGRHDMASNVGAPAKKKRRPRKRRPRTQTPTGQNG